MQLTAEATKLALGKKPQLMPLLTARFIADGPGKRFIDSGCDRGRFEICHVPIGRPDSAPLILFGTTPDTGAYMLGDAGQRLRMGQQDTAFALAVAKYDPAGVMWAMTPYGSCTVYAKVLAGCGRVYPCSLSARPP